MLEKIKDLSENFFNNLWVNIENLKVEEKDKNIYYIKIKTNDSWLVIWPNWKNLSNISNILKLMINKLSEERIKVYLEVNDYIESKDERFKKLILEKISYVEKSWNDLKLPYYNAYERKKIHSIVAEYNNDKIYTKSIWEAEERRLYICKVNEKLTIDIDWDDI